MLEKAYSPHPTEDSVNRSPMVLDKAVGEDLQESKVSRVLDGFILSGAVS